MRTKLITVGLGLVVAFVVGVAITPTPAPAANMPSPALVIRDSGCGMLNGDGVVVFTPSTHAVITSSGQGKLTCRAKGLANSTGRAVVFTFSDIPLLCGTVSDVTIKWTNVVSASGNGTLTCQNDG